MKKIFLLLCISAFITACGNNNERVKDIDNLIQHIYEDNISGKITDDRFATLSLNYEKEQKNLKEKIKELSTTIDKTRQEEIDLTTFIAKV